jgi:hypothetical protein
MTPPCRVCGRTLMRVYVIPRDTEPGKLTLDEETHLLADYAYCDNCRCIHAIG